MSWTKRELINQAYSELGYADYAFDLRPEQLQGARRLLDAMIAEWDGTGLFVGYPFGDDDLNSDSNIPDVYLSAVYSNLAMRIAPGVGRQPMAQTIAAAERGMTAILQRQGELLPRKADYASVPAGSGNYPYLGIVSLPEDTDG